MSPRPPVERWFLRRGIPHFIDGYSVRADILTRTVPFLSLVFLAEVLVTFGDRYRGWVQFLVVIGSLGVLLAAVVVVNRVRGRVPFARPDSIGIPELVAFLLAPALIALLFGDEPIPEALAVLGGNLVVLGVAYVAASYGLVPMVLWGFRQLRRQLHDVVALIVKTLPFLLLFSAFMLLATEVWQVVEDMPWAYYLIVIGGMVLLGALLVGVSTRTGVDELGRFDSWDDVAELCTGTPLASFDPSSRAGCPDPSPLPRRAQFNVALVMFVSQGIQILIVSAAVFAFYLGFGLIAIREPTLVAWVGEGALTDSDRLATFGFLGRELLLTRELLFVAGFIATFAGLQFAVQVVGDATYREEFTAGMAREVRQALAVRAASAAPVST